MTATVDSPSYIATPYAYQRRRTHEVLVGSVGVGGNNPIRIQSMTTTSTMDTEATVAQVERLVQVGCEIVRITAPGVKDARNLSEIRRRLIARDIHVPLVADIHFSPEAALEAAEHVDKVRINPGNYADSRKFAVREYSDAQYAAELERIEARFAPLVLKCKERGIAMRIGTNHGSLSDRIVNRFGDTPEGMVESALEFVRICEKFDYRSIILSMKASNPKVMIAAYRLLAARMGDLGMTYPFHLGVTEAGNGEDARIKSAIGIGSLLADGIGDTIRVSLAEEPEEEIPVAYALAARYTHRTSSAHPEAGKRAETTSDAPPLAWDPIHYERRASEAVPVGPVTLGGRSTPAVLARVGRDGAAQVLRWASPGARRLQRPDIVEWLVQDAADVEALARLQTRLQNARMLTLLPDAGQVMLPTLAILASSADVDLLLHALPHADGVLLQGADGNSARRLAKAAGKGERALWLEMAAMNEGTPQNERSLRTAMEAFLRAATAAATELGRAPVIGVQAPSAESLIYAQRLLVAEMAARKLSWPLLLRSIPEEAPLIPTSLALGSLLCDGIGDVVHAATPAGGQDDVLLTLNVLQAAGARLSKTDYVACPSCGRTLFDLQSTTERIKTKTSHLVGVKIAIMGCVVNGPGEMADADFGYVGGSPGHVNLYVGKTCVERSVPAEVADERLITLIKSHGRWKEPEPEDVVEVATAEGAEISVP